MEEEVDLIYSDSESGSVISVIDAFDKVPKCELGDAAPLFKARRPKKRRGALKSGAAP